MVTARRGKQPEMTVTQISPPREALAEGLRQALDALRSLGSLAPELGEQATLATRYTVGVRSPAEVDAVAAKMDVEPCWTSPRAYQAAWTEGTVTVTVSFTTDPLAAWDCAAAVESACRQVAGDVPGSAA
jgi:hypothetical protein